MKNQQKGLYIAGFLLLALAAFFSLSLLLAVFDFGNETVAKSFNIFAIGKMLVSVYGFSSIFIPAFLCVLGFTSIFGSWSRKKAMRFFTAFIPFFTLAATESICKSILLYDTSEFVVVKIALTLLAGAFLIAIEILLAGALAEKFAIYLESKKIQKARKEIVELPFDANPALDIADEKNDAQKIQSNENETEEIKTDKAFDNLFDYEKKSEKNSSISEAEFEALTADADELEWNLPEVKPDNFLEDENSSETSLDENLSEQNANLQNENFANDFEIENQPENLNEISQNQNSLDENLSEQNANSQNENFANDFEIENQTETLNEISQNQNAQNANSLDPDFFDIDINETNDDALDESETEIENMISDQNLSAADKVFADMEKDIQKDLQEQSEIKNQNESLTINQSSSLNQNENPATQNSLEKVEPKIPLAEKKIKTHKPKGAYKISSDLLSEYANDQYWIIDKETKDASAHLKETFSEFNIEADVIGIKKGPVVTMFEMLPAPGVKLSKIVALQDNIALRLAASSVRIVAPIPGKQAVGIEVPNKNRSIVSFREIIEKDMNEWKKMAVPVVLGKDILGKPQLIDLVKTPHLLIAGSTGSGKSVCVNSMILSILFKRSPSDVKLILIDPKIVELKLYNDIPHLLVPVVTESKKAFQALQWALCEMERRYALLDGMGCRDIASYNKKIIDKKIATEKLPYIVIIIDEFADLMATTGKELEGTVARLAAMSRAIGIHLVLATQRPSIDVITGLIKANIPSRIAFMVASKMDSRIIIDQVGAEKLLGKGDMLYASAADPFPIRIQGTFVSDEEVENVVERVKQYDEPDYIEDEMFVDDDDEASEPSLFSDGEDPLYNEALEIIMQAGKASASYIQRRLKIGYNRAARLVEEMEARGIVGPANGSKPREIIHVP